MDRINYSRWLPIYLADMNQLPERHPEVYDKFVNGDHAVSRSKQPFARVCTDMAFEQTINRDSKNSGGIIGISQRSEALERWFLTSHERAAITTTLRNMCGIGESERVGTHKDCVQSIIERDESDAQKLVEVITYKAMANPFQFDNDISPLTNIATGLVASQNVSNSLLGAKKIGELKLMEFVTKRLENSEIKFCDTLKKTKISTFASMIKKRKTKAVDEKIVSISADRDLFGRLVIVAKTRPVNLKEVLSYELSAVPYSLAHRDSTMRKTDKSVLMKVLESKDEVMPRLPVSESSVSTAGIVDGIAVLHMLQFGGAATFGELGKVYYNHITKALGVNGCRRIDIVFDSYRDISIKAGERVKRGSVSEGHEIHIHSQSTPVPCRWSKYIANVDNKKNLCNFLAQVLCDLGVANLEEGHELAIGGGFIDNEQAISVKKGQTAEIDVLKCDHEEGDTRLLLHAAYDASSYSRILVSSPDTDVMVLCIAQLDEIACDQLWFKTGTRDNLCFIPIHILREVLGEYLCHSLLGFHAITGCDSISSFFGKGKKMAFSVLEDNDDLQLSFQKFGECETVSEELLASCDKFVCNLYSGSTTTGMGVNGLRYWLFCQKRQTNENLPPTSDSLRLHVARANYQASIWTRALVAKQDLPSPLESGWENTKAGLRPVFMEAEPAAKGLVELTSCNCKKTACSMDLCTFRRNGLACTELCVCMADETCQNPKNTECVSDDDED